MEYTLSKFDPFDVNLFAADKEFEDLCFEFGVELDDIVSTICVWWIRRWRSDRPIDISAAIRGF